jgi:hypothetical protein
MTQRTLLPTVAALVLAAGALVRAHHSVPVNFDQSKEVTIVGVIRDIKWVNPHSHWRVAVTGDDGKSVEWLVEFGAMNTMKRAGFPMERYKPGDRVEITGNPGRRDRAVLLRQVLHNGVLLNPDMRQNGDTSAGRAPAN